MKKRGYYKKEWDKLNALALAIDDVMNGAATICYFINLPQYSLTIDLLNILRKIVFDDSYGAPQLMEDGLGLGAELAVGFVLNKATNKLFAILKGNKGKPLGDGKHSVVEVVQNIPKLSLSAFGKKSLEHLVKVEGFNKTRTGVIGGHNRDEFMAYFTKNKRAVKFVSEVQHPVFKGLYDTEYQVSIGIGGGQFSQTEFSKNIYPKTMYDPSVYTDDQIVKWAKEALEGNDITQVNNGKYVKGIASNGMKFEGWFDDSLGELSSFYPVFDWSYD